MGIKKVLIVGGGSAGWMTAAALSSTLGDVCEIILVESIEIGTLGVGEASIPLIRQFNNLLGINEEQFLRATQGTIKLGIEFVNWRAIGDSYMHAFGNIGADSWIASFVHFWLRAKQNGSNASLWDYSLSFNAAKSQKMSLADSGLDYAYHFDAVLYAKLLRQLSEAKGVRRIEGKVIDVECNKDTGEVSIIKLESDVSLTADLFIDCSGFNSLLLGQALGVEFEDWSKWLLCDSALAVQTERVQNPALFTSSLALPCGWQWKIPLQHRVGNGIVFSSQYIDKKGAQSLLLENLSGAPINEPRLIKFKPGRRRAPWFKNTVAIGLSAAFLEPLESTSLHLIQTAVARLIKLFPPSKDMSLMADEYNRQANFEIERIRDFIILHYHLTERTDSDFWNYCRSMDIPSSLQNKIDLFKGMPTVSRDADELFHEGSWQQVMIGQGVMPKNYHPVVNRFTLAELGERMENLKMDIVRRVDTYRSYPEILKRIYEI